MPSINEKPSIGENINSFIQRNRKPIYVSAGIIIVLLIVSIAAFSLMDLFRNRSISAVEELNSRYELLKDSINEEYMENDVSTLLADLETFAKKSFGYAKGRAWSLIGKIHSDKKDWANAEIAWVTAAQTSAKTYMAPLAWFNAAVAAEEQEKTEEAIACYASSISAPAGFSSAARAQFSIGRLRESLNENDAAIEAYRAVISGWPQDTVWTSLAHSRILALEAK